MFGGSVILEQTDDVPHQQNEAAGLKLTQKSFGRFSISIGFFFIAHFVV